VLPALLRVCVAAGRDRAAIVYAREYGSELASDAQFEFILALLESAMGEPDAAIDHLRGVVRRAPSHAEAHYRLAALLEDKNSERGEVAFHLREYLRLEPKGKYAEAASAALEPESSTRIH
jgi:tetratricopeptide (TPR) repeat protein